MVAIFNVDTDYRLVEPAHHCPYNARALNEDKTRVVIGEGRKAELLCRVLK